MLRTFRSGMAADPECPGGGEAAGCENGGLYCLLLQRYRLAGNIPGDLWQTRQYWCSIRQAWEQIGDVISQRIDALHFFPTAI